MNRTEFERLRDMPGKVIAGDIKFSRKQALAPLLVAEDIAIANDDGVDLKLSVHTNPMTGAKSVNVHVPGVGPICRLDVDGTSHGDAGRSHKHSLQSERCPDRNLPDGVIARADLSGQDVRAVFEAFCAMAAITHSGMFFMPEP